MLERIILIIWKKINSPVYSMVEKAYNKKMKEYL